jgi:hypothetical protein
MRCGILLALAVRILKFIRLELLSSEFALKLDEPPKEASENPAEILSQLGLVGLGGDLFKSIDVDEED